MTSLPSNSMLLHGLLQESNGVDVAYCRGETSAVVTAVPGGRSAEVDSDEFTVKARLKTWQVELVDLVLNETAITPEKGDLIKESISETHYRVWEVIERAGLTYESVGHTGEVIKIHVQDFGTEEKT